MKRLVNLAAMRSIAIVVMTAVITVGAFAQQFTPESDFALRVMGNSVTVTGYTGSNAVVNIPPTIQNRTVNGIFMGAFKGNTAITSVTIPGGVIAIANEAFANCTALANITIENGVGTIGNNAFAGTAIRRITIPASVTIMGDEIFLNCNNLSEITLENTIPASTLRGNVFRSLGDLRTKYVAGGAGTYTATGTGNNRVWTKQGTQQTTANPESDFQFNRSGNTVTIIYYIGTSTEVIIPATIQGVPVTAIGPGAFRQTNIASITIPASVTSIGESAFRECPALTSVTFQGSILSGTSGLHPWAFYQLGDIITKYYSGSTAGSGGMPGTYTREVGGQVWTRR